MILLAAVSFVVVDILLYSWAAEYGPRRPWHLMLGSGFYASVRRLRAGPEPKPKNFWDGAMELEPGHISVVTDKRSGNQYALMHLDDFDHLLSTGNKFVRRHPPQSEPPK